jgi:AcrR family transcriptional regulator
MAKSPARARRYAPRMRPEERREQLLDATLALIAEKGYESVSMEGIARRAGVTKPVVYDLFGSLADLLEALLEREEERALTQLDELMPAADDGADPSQVLVELLDAVARAVEARPDGWRLVLMPVEAMPGIVRERLGLDGGGVTERLESIARSGVKGMDLRTSDEELLVVTIVELTMAAGRRHLADPKRYPRERLTEFTRSLLESVERI